MYHPEESRLYRHDYRAPNFFAPHIELTIELDPLETIVTTQFRLSKNTQPTDERYLIDEHRQEADEINNPNALRLNGSEALTLLELKINGDSIAPSEWIFSDQDLYLTGLSDGDEITLKNRISPENNNALTGIFMTEGLYCSDCEPQGFRHITYFLDRPDNMAIYRVRLIFSNDLNTALSNGNLIESGAIDEKRNFTLWEDPFPKPTYLFAVVAGNLSYIEDFFPRREGSPVRLRIYADPNYIEQCHFALNALKNAMEWDEERFNLICDLDQYNIVAVNDFNGGAMENKGLNIFNSQYVFADEAIATDDDFRWIKAVIGHEYFHNWTGNRITCRDWFNLSLKEGLTVFREQEFIADRYHRGIKRIEDVQLLRNHQFPEDQGSLAHPVRPDSVQSIENLYTTTIYEKGAEIVRLYYTLLGDERFNRGFAHYIEQYDGQAVTTEQFLESMEFGYGRKLPHFDRWYSQAGTPQLYAKSEYDPINQTLRLSLSQTIPDTPSQRNKTPHIIPICYAFLNQDGSMPLEETFVLQEAKQCLLFHQVTEKPVISFLRGFSAPVELHYSLSLADLRNIIEHETDDYARWNASQQFYQQILLAHALPEEKSNLIAPLFEHLLNNATDDPQFSALLLTLPTLTTLLTLDNDKDAQRINSELNEIQDRLAKTHSSLWINLYQRIDNKHLETRQLRHIILQYLIRLPNQEQYLEQSYYHAINMTERYNAISIAVNCNHPLLPDLLTHFYQTYRQYPTVIDRWFALHATNPSINSEQLDALIDHPDFSLRNPNRVRALMATFIRNSLAFKANLTKNIAWYLNTLLKVDAINPQTSARLAAPLSQRERYNEDEYNQLQSDIKEWMQTENLSNNLHEQLQSIIKNFEK